MIQRRGPRVTRSHLLAGALLLALASSIAFVPGAEASVPQVFETVDTSFIEGDGANQVQTLAQSFVATADYKLLAVEVLAIDIGNSDTALLRIVLDAGGLPNGGMVSQGQFDGSAEYDWLRFDLSPKPVLVTGQRYWIQLISFENSPNGYRWAKTSNSSYGAGWAAYFQGSVWTVQPTVDYLFRTWGIRGPSITAGISADTTTAGPGDPIRYTITFNNVGIGMASRVWVNWTPSPEITYEGDNASASGGVQTATGWAFDSVGVGAHWFAVDVRANDDVFEGLPLTTRVNLQYHDNAGVLQEPSSWEVTVIARVPSLVISSSAMPGFVAPLDNLTYLVSISNVGSRPAARIWLNDTLPAEVAYVSDTASSLPNYTGGWSSGRVLYFNFSDVPAGVYTFRINVTVDAGTANGTWLVNWAMGNYTTSSGVVREMNRASAVARIHGASIRVSQSTISTQVQPGRTVRFTVRFDNLGNAVARDVWINDTIPVGLVYTSDTASAHPSFADGSCAGWVCTWHFRDVAPGLNSIVLTTTVASGRADGEVLANWANLTYTNSDFLPLAPSTSSASVVVALPVITVFASANAFANPGDILGYVVVVRNTGSGLARTVWLNATPPAGATYEVDNASDGGGSRIGPWSWNFENLTTGPRWFYLALRLPAGLADGTAVSNSFAVEYIDEAGNPGPPRAAGATTVITAPEIAIVATGSRPTAAPGDLVTYTLRIDNTGTGIAREVWVNHTIPDGATFVRSSLQYLSTSGSVFTWRLTNVPPGSVEMNVTVRVDAGIAAGTTLTDAVVVEFTDANGNYLGMRSGTIPVTVVGSGVVSETTLPLTVLLLGVLLALAVGFIGWKVYGFGQEKPRIDELFLLHRSGELVRHLTRRLRPGVDSDALSGMLVAVQDFIKESFQFVEGSLEELKFGSHRLMLAHGQHLILAAVVAGTRTERLAPALLSGLSALEREFAPALKAWNGMPSSLDGVDPFLEAILRGKSPNGRSTASPML